MRADRLLSILLLLQVHRRMTARSLAGRLEVSERTIHRDMEALCTAGVPLHAERGAGGGWVLEESFRTDLTGLTEAEAQALFLTTPPRVLADLGLEQASHGALVKLLAALPSPARRDAEFIRQRIHVDATGWRGGESPGPCFAAIQEAVLQEQRLRLLYGRDEAEPVERLVDPLGLVAKGNLWYLVAAVDGQPRTYRVSRVHAATITDERAVRPAGFDLAAFWASSSAAFVANLPRFPLSVRVDPAVRHRLWYPGSYARVERTGEPEADGRLPVDLTLQSEEEACAYALGFGARMEVLAPASVRECVRRAAEETVALYRSRALEAVAVEEAGEGG